VAGTGEAAGSDDGKPAIETDLYLPSAARRGPDGLVYVMDFNNFRLRLVREDCTIRSVAGNGEHAVATEGVPAWGSPLENPVDFAFEADGSILIVSLHDPRVLRVGQDGVLGVLAGSLEPGDDGDGGPALQAHFQELRSVAIGPDGTVYVADALSHRVRAIGADGVVRAFAGTGEEGDDGDGGTAREARLAEPEALAVEPSGAVLIADSKANVVRRVRPDGMIERVAGTGVRGFGGDGGPARSAILSRPSGLAVGEGGAIYLSDAGNDRVRVIDPDGRIATVAGSGAEPLAGDGGPAAKAHLRSPARLSVLGSELLLADQGNGCVRRVQLP
jgi:hypothetical protein